MLTNYWKFQNRSVQTFGFVYHDTNGQNHGPVWKTQSFPLERNLYGHPLAGLIWERQFERILLKHGWEKIPNWECLSAHREKGFFLSVRVDDIKLLGKKQNLDPMCKVLNKEVHLGEPKIFPRSCVPGVYSKTMWNEQRYCGQFQNHVWISNFRGESREITIPCGQTHNSDGKMTTIAHVRQQPITQPRKPRAKELALWRSHHPAWMGASHGWVPVNTHSTPVRTSVRRLWVARTTSTTRAQTSNPSGG